MNPAKALALTLYYHATRPLRWFYRHRAAAAHRLPLAVLFYHRVADDAATPWTLSNRLFARQIAWLQRHRELISLEEAQRRLRSGRCDRPAVSITFDDGYADNCQAAIPLLIQRHIPCTYFVTLRNVAQGTSFSHDRMLGKALAPNTIEQLRAMAAAGIEIGAHTATHCNLGAIVDRRRLHYEIAAAGEELQQLVGRPVRYFAFPFGQRENLNPAAFEMAYESGYEGVCSAYGGYNMPGDDAFHLQRIGVNADLIGLKNWLTFDPRKLHLARYQYAAAHDPPAENRPASPESLIPNP